MPSANHRLIGLRLDLEMSVTRAAEMIGISSLDLHLYEQGDGCVWKDGDWTSTALRIAKFHGVGPEEIWSEGKAERRAAEYEAAIRIQEG